jgi:hypothetical protein
MKQSMKCNSRTTVLLAGLALLGLAPQTTAWANSGPPIRPITTSRLVPLDGLVFANEESIHLTGAALVTVSFTPSQPISIYTLLGATGVGQTSGQPYTAYGEASFQAAAPHTAYTIYGFSANFRLIPGNPVRVLQAGPPIKEFVLPLRFLVGVNADGTVDGNAVEVRTGGTF